MPDQQFWNELTELGAQKIRLSLGQRIWREERRLVAEQWLLHYESSERSRADAEVIASARAANELARAANKLAEEANALALSANSTAEEAKAAARTQADAAKTSAIAAAIAIAISIVSIFIMLSHK